MEIRPVEGKALGAIVTGVDLSKPLADTAVAEIRRALLTYHVLCIRGRALSPHEFDAVARYFGEPQMNLLRQYGHAAVPEIEILSNANVDRLGTGKPYVSGTHWHTDDSYRAVPCSITLLHAQALPQSGGDTQFTNMHAAYEALGPARRQAIAEIRVVHQYLSRRNVAHVPTRSDEELSETPPVTHPIVRRHPETGRKALYLNPNRMDHVPGMSLEECDALLDDLIAHATQPPFQYRHQWQDGDLLIWDNRSTMHKANADYGEQHREMHRIILKGTVPV